MSETNASNEDESYLGIPKVGWKEGEVTPPSTSRGPGAIGNEHSGYDWIENSKLYMYRYRMEASAECGGIITRRAERSLAEAKTRGPDLSDWRVWAAATIRPGECPCGGTRGVCPYHP